MFNSFISFPFATFVALMILSPVTLWHADAYSGTDSRNTLWDQPLSAEGILSTTNAAMETKQRSCDGGAHSVRDQQDCDLQPLVSANFNDRGNPQQRLQFRGAGAESNLDDSGEPGKRRKGLCVSRGDERRHSSEQHLAQPPERGSGEVCSV